MAINSPRGSCTMCGDCCYPVSLGYGLSTWGKATDAVGRYNKSFTQKHWHRVSKKEATAMLLSTGRTPHAGRVYYYRCDAFDHATRSCTMQNEKPQICAGFPWYGCYADTNPEFGKPDAKRLNGLSRCGYWFDVPRTEWPPMVSLDSLISS